MTQNKWQIGPVKLANREDAFIDAINDGQDGNRYTGRVKGIFGDWVPVGWTSSGQLMYAMHGHLRNLAPPPKKTVRVRLWVNADADGRFQVRQSRETADGWAHANRIACKEIDIEVTEGEGL